MLHSGRSNGSLDGDTGRKWNLQTDKAKNRSISSRRGKKTLTEREGAQVYEMDPTTPLSTESAEFYHAKTLDGERCSPFKSNGTNRRESTEFSFGELCLRRETRSYCYGSLDAFLMLSLLRHPLSSFSCQDPTENSVNTRSIILLW